jgi:transposase
MGRSRGGLTTKIHALVDAEGLPIALKLTEGQAHDGRSATDMLASIKAGQILLADRAYEASPQGLCAKPRLKVRTKNTCYAA